MTREVLVKIRINEEIWYNRIYLFALEIWYNFKATEIPWRFENGSNLCMYIRTLVVWLPLTVILHLTTAALCIFTLFVFPSHLFGWGYAKFGVGCVLFVGLLILAVYVWKKSENYLDEHHTKKCNAETAEPIDKGPSLTALFIEWIKAKKKMICPLIEFYTPERTRGGAK